jgi:hypothetical protein
VETIVALTIIHRHSMQKTICTFSRSHMCFQTICKWFKTIKLITGNFSLMIYSTQIRFSKFSLIKMNKSDSNRPMNMLLLTMTIFITIITMENNKSSKSLFSKMITIIIQRVRTQIWHLRSCKNNLLSINNMENLYTSL